jgi:hypothetical protein
MASDHIISVDVDAELIERARAMTPPHGQVTEAAVVERALRMYVGRDVLEAAQATSDLTDEEADELAVEELHAARRARRGSS